jgi:Raf kinase inhibitor-like YbhB/YbcL family protein
MRLLSSAIQNEQPIPQRYTCDGENVSPDFHWEEAPKEAKSFVLILHDPDAPRKNGFTHWVLYNIPSTAHGIPENISKQDSTSRLGIQGRNDSGQIGYTGPCPPSGKHRYFAHFYALREPLNLPVGATAVDVQATLEGKVIEQTELMGTYERAQGKSKASQG